jgi:hypothetical protein
MSKENSFICKDCDYTNFCEMKNKIAQNGECKYKTNIMRDD